MSMEITQQAGKALEELLSAAKLSPGDIVVVGCSTSEIAGKKIGTTPGPQIARELLDGFMPLLQASGLYLAAQCCEHLERALVVEKKTMMEHGLHRVNGVPQPKAGGSFATAVWSRMEQPVLVQGVQAAAGLDIGHTLIGMHLQAVAVPVRLSLSLLGEAPLVAARTRLPFVGGSRAMYDEDLL